MAQQYAAMDTCGICDITDVEQDISTILRGTELLDGSQSTFEHLAREGCISLLLKLRLYYSLS